jgi:hypothetical protein
MPYYVFKMQNAELAILKQLELLKEFEKFKEAKNFAKEQRAELSEADETTIKVMFADNLLSAEEQLMEAREQPIVMEHEK